MPEGKLNELLNKLHAELEQTKQVDQDTLEQVRDLDEEINRLLESGGETEEFDNAIDRAKAVETRFALDHPVAERFLREIIDALSKVGI